VNTRGETTGLPAGRAAAQNWAKAAGRAPLPRFPADRQLGMAVVVVALAVQIPVTLAGSEPLAWSSSSIREVQHA